MATFLVSFLSSFMHSLPRILMALWWGSLSTIGFIVVPLLFEHLPNVSLAGNMAAKLFAAQSWIAIGCAVVLLLLGRSQRTPVLQAWVKAQFAWLLLALLLAVLIQYGISPRIVARESLAFWHGLASVLYTLEWVCCTWLLLKAR